MTGKERTVLLRIERLLKRKNGVFCGPPEFIEHRNFPKNGVMLSDVDLIRRQADEGYIKFSSIQWTYKKIMPANGSLHMVADVIECMTDKWGKEKREHERHVILLASFFFVGVISIAIAIYREFWR